MTSRLRIPLTVALAWVAVAFQPLRGADDAMLVPRQRDKAQANWKYLFDGQEPIHIETANLLLYAPPPYTAAQVRGIGATLEAVLTLARKNLGLGEDDTLWSGKLAVYILDEPSQFRRFLLAVAKKRPEPDDVGAFGIRSDFPFVGAGPGQQRYDPSAAEQAGIQLAAAVLSRKAGGDVPDWVVTGYGEATLWRASPGASNTRRERARARKLLLAGRMASDIWDGKARADEVGVLQASLIEFLAYGPGAKKFASFLQGFKVETPQRNNRPPTPEMAFKSAGLSLSAVNNGWRAWARR